MFEAIVHGIGLGLLMAVLVGPVFFALMGVALHYSKRAAIWFAVGTSLSDCIYALIVYISVGTFRLSHTAKWRMWVCGWLVFIVMGIVMIVRTLRHEQEKHKELHLRKHPHRSNFLGQGFVTNSLNPSVVLFWATAVSSSVATLPRRWLIPVLIITTLVTFFTTDLIKVSLAEKLKNIITQRTLYHLHLVTWGLLIALGIFVIIKTLFAHHF